MLSNVVSSVVLTVLSGVTLRLEPTTASPTTVVFRVTNTGDAPVRVVDHRGLLRLEVRVPGRRAAVRCRAPAGAVPSAVDPERIVVLAPGASMAEAVDVRWYCWGRRAEAALATPGATVSARYGFARARERTWIVSTPDGATRVGALDAESIELPASPDAASTPDAAGATLSLRAQPARSQSSDGRSVTLHLQLKNESPDDVRLFVRPDLFRFQVTGPTESRRCGLPSDERTPQRESFDRLRPRGRTSLYLDLSEICPSDTFAAPGVYDIEPVFEATENGAARGLRAFTGTIVGVPALVRVTGGDLSTYETVEPPP